MPADRSSPGANRRASPTDAVCTVCHKRMNRAADLKRHMKNHDPNAQKFECPEPGCTYTTLQKSNLKTHMNQHGDTKKKPHSCPDCAFMTSDPGALTRHRQRKHEYDPYGRRASKKAASMKKSAESEPVKPARRTRAPVAGSSSHANALEVPPIATLEGAEESSDSSDAESVKTDQFYPSSVSSEGYDKFAGLTAMTPQPQTPPPSQLFLSSPAPQQVSKFKLESEPELSSLESPVMVKAEPFEQTLSFFEPQEPVAGPSNLAYTQFPSSNYSFPSSDEQGGVHQDYYPFDQFAADHAFGLDSNGSVGCVEGERWEPLNLFTKGQSDLLDYVEPLQAPPSPKSDCGSSAGSTFVNSQADSPLPSNDMDVSWSSSPFSGHDFILPQGSQPCVPQEYWGVYPPSFIHPDPQLHLSGYPTFGYYGTCA